MKIHKINAIEILEARLNNISITPVELKMTKLTVSLIGNVNKGKYEWGMNIRKADEKSSALQVLTLAVLPNEEGKVQLIAQNKENNGVSILVNDDKKTSQFIEAFLTYFFSFQGLEEASQYIISFPKCLDYIDKDVLLLDNQTIPKKILQTFKKKQKVALA